MCWSSVRWMTRSRVAGEVRIRVAFSGVNPGDVKKREDAFGLGMPYPRVIPHSDGSGTVDAVGEGVSREWIGRRVWCYGAQVLPSFRNCRRVHCGSLKQVVQLPEGVPLEQGACLGIPGITAHRAVHVAGSVEGRTVLGARRCGCGRSLCRSTSASGGSASHRHLPRRKRQGNRIASRGRRCFAHW